jgi:DNA-binding transcriptional ArsR family regulator
MSNENLFKALSSPTRIKILKVLVNEEIHLTALAKKIGLSKPVVSRHIKILEKTGLINKRIIGNIYLLKTNAKNIEKVLEPFIESQTIIVNKNKSIFDALKQIPGIEVKKQGSQGYIKSINDEKGYYIYEVNGVLPEKPIDEYQINNDLNLVIKKIVTIKKKSINIKLKDEK